MKFQIFSQPDYDDIEEETRITLKARGKSDKGKEHKKYGKFSTKIL